MLTTLDKLWWVIFTVVAILGGVVGASLALICLIPPNELPAPGHNFSLGQALLILGGVVFGYAVVLAILGLMSRRFVSPATHERWAEYLDAATFAQRRYLQPFKLLRWVLLPEEYRQSQTSVRSNNRWRGP